MEEIKAPKKERKFLKGLGEIALVLIRELVLGIGKKVINKVGNKRERLVIAIIILASSITFAQYPATGNKQRLGYQTTGDGLVFRGRSNDTTALKPSSLNNAYHIFDTVNNVLFSYIKTKGGWKFNNSDTVIINGVTMPFDSITFNTSKDGTVGVGEVEYNDTQGSLIQGLKGGLVTNVIGQQLHQRVNNRTGSILAKGTAVYLSGSQGNRITVAKALGVTDAFSANTFGIVAESIANNQSGYVITEGLITGINTSALVEDSAVYLSPTVAGGLTSTKPQAPQHTVYIGVCVKSNAGSGELFVKIRNGQELDELHDVRITSPVNNASLYYKLNEKLWRDTTAVLLVSDTASMLTPYFRDLDTTLLNLTSRFATKLNISDTSSMLTNYLRTGVAALTYLTQSSAASTYLPLAGGTLTGTLNGINQNLTTNLSITDPIPENPPRIYTSVTTGPSSSASIRLALDQAISGGANMFMGGTQLGGGNAANPNIFFTDTRRAYASIGGVYTGAAITSSGHIIFNTTPNDATTALTERMRIASDGAITIGGTLGVTGATTLSGAVTVNNATVLNEGSGDFDTRIESDGNANMVFVDASTDRVGIGTNTPSKTLEVNGTFNSTSDITEGGLNVLTSADTASLSSRIDGKVSLTATETINGTKTFNNLVNITNQMTISGSVSGANILLGKNTSNNGVGDITIGTGLSLASNILTATQIDTTSLSNRINVKVGLTGNETISGDKTFTNKIILNDSSRFESNVLFKKNFGLPIVKISNANYTATTANHTIIYTILTSDKTLTIPNAADATGIKYTISIFDIPEGNEALTLITPSSNLFVRTDGENSSVDIVGGFCTVIQSDGIKWYILSYAPMY